MTDTFEIFLIMLTFLLAGTIKGVIGLGLPTISLSILTLAFSLEAAMALLLAPSLATNLWQALMGKHTRVLLSRLKQFLTVTIISVFIGAVLFRLFNPSLLAALLGLLIMTYAIASLLGYRPHTPANREAGYSQICGLFNGVFTGLTGSFVVPGVMYLQSLGLKREPFIQAMGMLFSVSTLALALALWWQGRLPANLSQISLIAVLPALAGMPIGQALAKHLSEAHFKTVFYTTLIGLGGCLTIKTLIAM